jgi:hypothetical protein
MPGQRAVAVLGRRGHLSEGRALFGAGWLAALQNIEEAGLPW